MGQREDLIGSEAQGVPAGIAGNSGKVGGLKPKEKAQEIGLSARPLARLGTPGRHKFASSASFPPTAPQSAIIINEYLLLYYIAAK